MNERTSECVVVRFVCYLRCCSSLASPKSSLARCRTPHDIICASCRKPYYYSLSTCYPVTMAPNMQTTPRPRLLRRHWRSQRGQPGGDGVGGSVESGVMGAEAPGRLWGHQKEEDMVGEDELVDGCQSEPSHWLWSYLQCVNPDSGPGSIAK